MAALVLMVPAYVWLQNEPRLGIAPNPAFTWGNALQVAYPEYQIRHGGPYEMTPGFFRYRTLVEIETHASTDFSESPRRVAEISQNIVGEVTYPTMGPTSMTPFLSGFKGGTPARSGEKEQARTRARSVPARQRVIVLAELAAPLPEPQVPIHVDSGEWKRYFLSGVQPSSGKPLYWWPGWGGCTAMAISGVFCGTRNVIDDYRQWLGQFTDGDSDALAEIGLDLKAMKAAAAEGRIYGFLHTDTGPDEILDLLDLPEIRTVHIVETVPEPEE
ncbi:hypothetical protein ABGB18_48765 [Nonomuraea sp. B12E4]|uniref:hypothetical protein n=1 Tax=Nonomuraea sp. B12E4 TaxID=3153564 RepID=UPI00325E83D7